MNSVPKPLSIQRCCALPHSEGDDLSEEEITAVRDPADAMARVDHDLFRERRSKSYERDYDIEAV